MNERKKLQELNLSDNFLFGKVMEDKQILKAVLEEILQFKIARVELADMQKTLEINDFAKGIRLDVYAADDEKNIYSVEMQNQNEYNIAKRSRYYKSTMDIDLLTRGMKYTQLTKSFVIFICMFDAFKMGKLKYNITPNLRSEFNHHKQGVLYAKRTVACYVVSYRIPLKKPALKCQN